MKLGFEIAYGLVVFALIGFIVRAFHQDRKISKNIKWVLGIACLSVLSSILQLAATSGVVADVAYGVFFVSLDWLLATLVWFADEYCSFDLSRFVKPYVIVAICLVDTVQILLNPILHHAYRMRLVTRENTPYWVYDALQPFRIHLIWCYVLVAVMVAILINKAIRMPMMYCAKYVNIMLILCTVILLDGLHLILGTVIDFSVLGFPVAAMAVYYYAIEFVPRALVNETLGLTVDAMLDGLIIMDADRRAIYANDCVREMLDLKEPFADTFSAEFDRWCREHYQSSGEDFVYDWTKEEPSGEKCYLKVSHSRLMDESGKQVGSYLNVQERTVEVQALLKERFAANHDYLTGLYNREYFFKQAERALRLHPDEKYLMICSDVRNFKMINDVFGVKAADQLLIDIAQELRSQSKRGEIYGRLVNDRFAILMKKRDYREVKFADRSAEVMKVADDVSYPLRIYIGVYEIDDVSLPISVMCDRAMMAIATIKGDYQKKVAYYDEKLRSSVLQEQDLAAGLDRAIEQGQIELYIQPQISSDGGCMGGEGLVRWNHPVRGLLMPAAFIPSFERNGMIVKLDLFVWELACRQLQKWKAEGFADRYISVNISPKDFFFVDIFKEFTSLVGRYGIQPKNLKLEITETAMMTDLPKQLKLIRRLREAGFIVEMDDFGSGYSSLNMLKDIRVDMLKIDMEFLRRSESEERSRTILRTVVALSKELGMPVVTEGVETKDHVDFLREIGCDLFQGYFFAKPMRVSDYEKQYLYPPKVF